VTETRIRRLRPDEDRERFRSGNPELDHFSIASRARTSSDTTWA